ncbi:hypothetical protein C8R44DRAFT_992167 [Mycena epipterygia]|nr:hypothetical protein C8R44DRAFT_992167 [Mycena epipterygia]
MFNVLLLGVSCWFLTPTTASHIFPEAAVTPYPAGQYSYRVGVIIDTTTKIATPYSTRLQKEIYLRGPMLSLFLDDFKAFLQIPLFPRIAAPALTATRLSAAGPHISLPEDILHVVVEELVPADILGLILAPADASSPSALSYSEPPLLASGIFWNAHAGVQSEFQVRTLTVRPNYYLTWPTPDTPISEVGIAIDTMSIAQSGSLARLRNFDWDGCEMPPCEKFGRVLRKSCPELTEIFANVGARALPPCSELFNFSALTSFSLSVRQGVTDESSLFPDPKPLPLTLWAMLLTRCSNLTSLTITSFSPGARLFALTPLISARFPALTSLTLGSFGYKDDFTVDFLPLVQWRDFLAARPQLICLRLAWNFRHWMSPEEDAAFKPPLPVALNIFAGVPQQLPGYCLSSLSHPQLASLTRLDLMVRASLRLARRRPLHGAAPSP